MVLCSVFPFSSHCWCVTTSPYTSHHPCSAAASSPFSLSVSCSLSHTHTLALAVPDVDGDDVMADQRHWTPVLVCFCPENIPRRRGCTRGKSSALISFQTALRSSALTTAISRWLGSCESREFVFHLPPPFGLWKRAFVRTLSRPLDNTWSSQGLSRCGVPQRRVNNQSQRGYKRRRGLGMLWWFPRQLQCK